MKLVSLSLIRQSARMAIGALLVIAAGFKAHGLIVDPLKSELLGIPLWVQVLAIEFELILGLWLLSGARERWALAAAAIFFAIVSCVAAKQALDTQSSCGCFGVVDVNPRLVLGMDIFLTIVISGLFCFPPNASTRARGASFQRQVALDVAVISLLVALSGRLGIVDYPALVRSIRGEALEVAPRVVDLGHTLIGEKSTERIQVWNHSDRPVVFHAKCLRW